MNVANVAYINMRFKPISNMDVNEQFIICWFIVVRWPTASETIESYVPCGLYIKPTLKATSYASQLSHALQTRLILDYKFFPININWIFNTMVVVTKSK